MKFVFKILSLIIIIFAICLVLPACAVQNNADKLNYSGFSDNQVEKKAPKRRKKHYIDEKIFETGTKPIYTY